MKHRYDLAKNDENKCLDFFKGFTLVELNQLGLRKLNKNAN